LPRYFTVDVFEKVGTRQVSLADLAGGSGLLSAEVPRADSDKVISVSMKVDLKNIKSDPIATQKIQAKTSRVHETIKAKNYLDGHGVQKKLQTMVHNLLTEQPENPTDFMLNFLEANRSESEKPITVERGPAPEAGAAARETAKDSLLAAADSGTLTKVLAAADNGSTIEETHEKLKLVFEMCDVNRDGSITKIEFIKACRTKPWVAELFKLPTQIRQEDGSRTKTEHFFQKLDKDDSKTITWEEFHDFYRDSLSETTPKISDVTASSHACNVEENWSLDQGCTSAPKAALAAPPLGRLHGNGSAAHLDILCQEFRLQVRDMVASSVGPPFPDSEAEARAQTSWPSHEGLQVVPVTSREATEFKNDVAVR
jgi:hypothetical protein